MKKIFFVFSLLCLVLVAFATQMIVHTTSGDESFELSEITSITFSNSSEGLIAFVSNRDGNNEIYCMNEDGSEQTNLTNNSANDSNPAISPNSTSLAFVSDRTGNNDVYIMDIDGSNVGQVTQNATSEGIRGIDWINNTTLVFSGKNNGVYYLYTVNIDGTNLCQISDSSLDSSHPDVNYNGSKIYLKRNTPYNDYTSKIYSCNIDGSNMVQLTDPDMRDPAHILVNDVEKVIFCSHSEGQIYIMNSDGTSQTNISNNQFNEYTPHSDSDSELVFSSDRDGSANIWKMNSDGIYAIQLTTEGGSAPYWRR